MKKILYSALALGAVLSMASCASDEPFAQKDNDGKVHFTIALDGDQTRAFGDASTINCNQIAYTVFDMDGKVVIEGEPVAAFGLGATTATVDIQLVANQQYQVIFYANNSEGFSKYSEGVVTVDYGKIHVNSTTDDAFINKKTYNNAENQVFTADGNAKTVYLTRPFAQVNIGTDDLTNPAVEKILSGVSTQLSIAKGLYTTYTALPAEGAEQVTVPVDNAVNAGTGAPEDNTDFPVAGYSNLLSMYMLVPQTQDMIDATYTINLAGKPAINTLNLNGMPVQGNYRTNIYGSLLTTMNKFNVTIEPNFGDPDFNDGVVSVTTAEEAAAAVAKGGIVKVTAPIDLIDLSSLNAAMPLNLMLMAPVTKINIGTTLDDPTPITIEVADGVAFPKFNVNSYTESVRNLTIKGTPTSSQPLVGFRVTELGNNQPKAMTNVTLKGVHLDTKGVYMAHSNGTIIENMTIEDCNMTNLIEPGVSFQAGGAHGNVTIKNNTVSFAPNAASTANGLYLLGFTGPLTVTGNTIIGAPYHGIFVMANAKANLVTEAFANATTIISGNTIENPNRDGVKIENCIADMTVSNNIISAHDNGIRVKGFLADNTFTVTGNTINVQNMNAFTGEESWGILFVDSNSTAKPVINVYGNKKEGTTDYWFKLTGVTPAESSNYANPW